MQVFSTHPMPVAIIGLKNRSPSPLAQLFIDNLRAFTNPLAKLQQGTE
jgi:hypothetical protein